ncbi:MAG: phage baseplate assembly protein V [Desulfovibrio sp.]|nr:phage baseplate assembly protein V [Desulfovibrio sp.]
MSMFDLAALERRVAALEASQTASLRFGRVTGVKGGKVRAQFQDGQGMNSYDLSTVQKRVLKDKYICMPDIGEPVACLFSGQGCEQGVVLGAYYNGREEDPGQESYMDYRQYEDGTQLWYDRQNHRLVARVKGDCEIEAEKTIRASCREEAEIHSEKELVLKAPQIKLQGVISMENYDGGFTSGELRDNFHVVEGDITAEAVSLRQHCHENSGGSGTGGKPVGG